MANEKSSSLQFPQLYIVEASAGSGKTYTLAKRYIQLLINSSAKPDEIPLNAILAITFTNKAALEMKERILELLKKIALDKFDSAKEKEDILSSLSAGSEESIRKKAHAIMDELIKNYNFFQVQTIDSFINAILSGCAFKLDLSAGFRIKTDYSEYLAYSLDKLIDKAAYDKDVLELFRNFLLQYLYIQNRTGWFPKQDILSLIAYLFKETNKYGMKFVRNKKEGKDILFLKKNVLKSMNRLAEILPEGTHGAFAKSLPAFAAENKESFDIDDVSDYFKHEEFPVKKGYNTPPESGKLWDKIKKDLSALCELESSSVFNYYIDIFNDVIENLKAVSSKDDVLFLEALNKEARKLFDDATFTLPELYCRMASRFRHFLIDEFQDTSSLQWQNLFIMIEEALSSDGSLFYVGDRKQAIYRFRGGEVSLIDMAKERFKNSNLIESSLNKNYRSQKEIVEFNNSVFSEGNLRRFFSLAADAVNNAPELSSSDTDEIIKVFEGSAQSHRENKGGGYVKTELVDAKTQGERDDIVKKKLLSLIAELNKRFQPKDIAILTRKNEEVELVTSWLIENGISVESDKTLDIRENSYIKEVISFLKFLNSPIDNLSFASFILGDIFLRASAISRADIEDFIFRVHLKPEKERSYLYREFKMKFPKAWDGLIEEFFKSVGFVPLYELLISIFGKFNAIKDFSDYQGFFMRLLELIKEQEEERPSISAFLEYFDEAMQNDLYVRSAESNSVKVLTVHKSKGLEFGVVIIPFLEINVKVSPRVVDSDEGVLKLMHIKKKYRYFSSSLADIYDREYKKSLIDELNNIYVAFTRPVYELYIFAGEKAEKGFNLARLLLPENRFECGAKKGYSDNKKKDKALSQELPPPEYKDWIGLLKDEFIDEGFLRAKDKVRKGEVIHYALSFIGNLHNKDVKLAVKEAVDKTKGRFYFIDNLSRDSGILPLSGKDIESDINKLLKDEALKPYFDLPDGEVYQEKEVANRYGDIKRIDRLIVKKKEAIVIDYKSAKDKEGGYKKQVAEYMKIIKDIYPGLSVRGVLVYLDTLSAEEVDG